MNASSPTFLNERAPVDMYSPVTRIKVFRFRELEYIEKEINEWMSLEKVIIRHVAQSQSEKQGWFVFVVTVYYETLSD